MNRLSRIARFVLVMFPPQIFGVAGLLKFFAPYFLLQLLAGRSALALGPSAIPGALSMVLFLLLFRVYDELKDAEGDRQLAAAGDPRYAERPIVLGTIEIGDLVAMKWTISALLFALNAILAPVAWIGFALLFGTLWLSSRWFFAPRIKDDLILALVTHNPIVVLMLVYVAGLVYADFGLLPAPSILALTLVGLWLPATTWEIARKVRIPADETAYQTYSMRFGWRLAPFVALACATVSTLCIVGVLWSVGFGLVYPAALVLALVVFGAACLRFRLAPSRESARLQPYSEVFVLAVDGGLVVALIVTLGLVSPWS